MAVGVGPLAELHLAGRRPPRARAGSRRRGRRSCAAVTTRPRRRRAPAAARPTTRRPTAACAARRRCRRPPLATRRTDETSSGNFSFFCSCPGPSPLSLAEPRAVHTHALELPSERAVNYSPRATTHRTCCCRRSSSCLRCRRIGSHRTRCCKLVTRIMRQPCGVQQCIAATCHQTARQVNWVGACLRRRRHPPPLTSTLRPSSTRSVQLRVSRSQSSVSRNSRRSRSSRSSQ